jgi:hypothetical protein
MDRHSAKQKQADGGKKPFRSFCTFHSGDLRFYFLNDLSRSTGKPCAAPPLRLQYIIFFGGVNPYGTKKEKTS